MSAQPVGLGGFIWPAVDRRIAGTAFGPGHPGIDIAAGMGDTIWAADEGLVVFADELSDGCIQVVLDHGAGWRTVYAHLSRVLVTGNQVVGQGQAIGLAGSTGNSTGPHLHFEVWHKGQAVDPQRAVGLQDEAKA
jgi:murein DD-endopeptidase MepM/ murein hydrolase activator NlpD